MKDLGQVYAHMRTVLIRFPLHHVSSFFAHFASNFQKYYKDSCKTHISISKTASNYIAPMVTLPKVLKSISNNLQTTRPFKNQSSSCFDPNSTNPHGHSPRRRGWWYGINLYRQYLRPRTISHSALEWRAVQQDNINPRTPPLLHHVAPPRLRLRKRSPPPGRIDEYPHSHIPPPHHINTASAANCMTIPMLTLLSARCHFFDMLIPGPLSGKSNI